MKRTALVTGGAQGIGRGIVQKLLNEGLFVIAVDIDPEAGKDLLDEMDTDDLIFKVVDISDHEKVKKLSEELEEEGHVINVLVNNAGISKFYPLEEISPEQWFKILNTNLSGAFFCSKYFAKALKSHGGYIVNISSTRSLMSEPDNEAYAASKGGLNALTHSLANSLGPEVKVNSISPGWIKVSDWKKKSQRKNIELSEEDHRQHPAGRVGKPEDIANLVWYLCSGQADFITGQNLVADGGMTIKMIYV